MNNINLIGRLCADPEMKTTSTGNPFAIIRLAVNRRYVRKDGTRPTDFFDCTANGKTAEFLCNRFKKGNSIAITGSLENAPYTDKNGVKHQNQVIRIQEISFTGERNAVRTDESALAPDPASVVAASAPAPTTPPTPETISTTADFNDEYPDFEGEFEDYM